MLLQTNSYIVPKERRAEHARLMRRFRQILHRIGCDNFEVYEVVGNNWSSGSATGRFVQIMRFRDRKHQLAVQNLERTDPTAQELIAEFCELVNYPYQQQNGLFAVGFYNNVLPVSPGRSAAPAAGGGEAAATAQEETATGAVAGSEFGSQQTETEAHHDAGIMGEQAGTYAQMPLDEKGVQTGEQPSEQPIAQDGEFVTDDAPVAEQESAVEEEQPVTEPAVAAGPDERDEWSLMDEARVPDDAEDEPLGFDLQTEPVEGAAPEPANGEAHLGPEEEEDDLARMANRLAESDDAPQGDSNRPRRR
jgi:hypothetical protein